jgi:hypothetical protein
MRREQHLELHLTGTAAPDVRESRPGKVHIDRIEGPITAREVPRITPGASALRYFLDGTQRTFFAYLFGSIPVVASVSAAAVLERNAAGQPDVMPGMLELAHTWFVPLRLPAVEGFVKHAREIGIAVVDPIAEIEGEEDYAAIAGDYGRLVEYAYRAAGKVRERLEDDLLRRWSTTTAGEDGWIVVDGALRRREARAIGLVKSFTRQYLSGEEAACLFSLPPGHRTGAFKAFIPWLQHDSDAAGDGWRTLWYLRFWDARGRDARHSLVRVEVDPDLTDPAHIDRLSSWLLAERVPRATADARWATLLYPVHYLERILKRYVDADTRGWPGSRPGA